MMKYVEKGTGVNHSVAYEFDKLNNMTALVETINGTENTTRYSYDEDNRPTSVVAQYSSRNCTYDGFGRVSQLATRHEGTNVFTQQYTYISNTNQVSGVTFGGSWQNKTYSYTYDKNGNITSVSDGTYTTSYVYDSANQLIRENNQEANTTTLWTYDDAGNILSRQVYPYTTGTPANRTQNVAYTYNNTNWGDLLTAYNGTTITYDGIGNPLNDGTWTYTWQHGRQLKTMAKSGETWQYTYNADGLRTKRTSGSRTYQYTYVGSQLTHMTVDGHTLYFTYDASGTPLTLTYDGNKFYYVTNLQGDVISIINGNGREFVRYTYDAWGNPITTDGSATNLCFYNPLRYRGYVYDPETELYYLQSRYYNPEIGRFINADGFASTGQGLLGNNMFAYCLNNPVNYVDRNGKDAVAVQLWTGGMWWLCGVDAVLPIGDVIYFGGIIALATLITNEDNLPEIIVDDAYVGSGFNPQPPDDDDDWDDDYYDDESNFGGRKKVGKSKGKTPGNNQAQNKQFKDATKGLSKDVRQSIHSEISQNGLGYHDIRDIAKEYFVFPFLPLTDKEFWEGALDS